MTTLMYFKLHLDFTTTVNNTLTLLRRRKPRDARRKPPLNAFGQMELEDRRAFAEDEGIGIGKVRLPLDEWLKEARGRGETGVVGVEKWLEIWERFVSFWKEDCFVLFGVDFMILGVWNAWAHGTCTNVSSSIQSKGIYLLVQGYGMLRV